MATKPKIAFFDFTSCEGCQLTVIDLLQTHLGLLDLVEIVQFREAMTERDDNYQVAFIEGSCTRKSDEARLQKIREQAAVVVALGACAHLGGVNALKNYWPLEAVQTYVYGKNGKDAYESYPSRPISAVIKVDAVIPGCPIDRFEFLRIVQYLLQGRQPHLPDYPLCVECKLQENACLNKLGKPCLVGCAQLAIDTAARSIALGGQTLHEGDSLWIDAEAGLVFAREPAVAIEKPLAELAAVAAWRNAQTRDFGARAEALLGQA